MAETKIKVSSNVDFKPKKSFKSTAKDKMGKFARSFFDSIQIIVIALAVVVLVYMFVASFNIVDGDSMLPNFHTGDTIISEKITTTFGKLQRGDVVVFQATTGKDFIKRVIGLPGDTVMVKSGKVFVNNVQLNENYLSDDNKDVPPGTAMGEGVPVYVPDGYYIVMGDNRHNSLDSRNLGPVEKSRIKGKAWLQIWSHESDQKLKFIEHVRYPELGDK